MPLRLRRWLEARATGRNVVAAVVLAIVVGSLFNTAGPQRRVLDRLDDRVPLERRFGYNGADVQEIFTVLGEDGRRANPASVAIFLGALLWVLVRRLRGAKA